MQLSYLVTLGLGLVATTAVADDKLTVYKGKPNCQIASRGRGDLGAAVEGLKYLAGKGDEVLRMGPGPGKCGRISCSYKTAIQFCNDGTKDLAVPIKEVAALAMDVANQCNLGYSDDFNGQEWNTTDAWNWNVVIEAADC